MTHQAVPAASVKVPIVEVPQWGGPPAVVVHDLAQARAALAPGLAVTLLSAPGAGVVGGAMWWRALMRRAAPAWPDILDCADDAAAALAALREGQAVLVLRGPGAAVVAEAAGAARVLTEPPPALDLLHRGAARRLYTWLSAGAAGSRS